MNVHHRVAGLAIAWALCATLGAGLGQAGSAQEHAASPASAATHKQAPSGHSAPRVIDAPVTGTLPAPAARAPAGGPPEPPSAKGGKEAMGGSAPDASSSLAAVVRRIDRIITGTSATAGPGRLRRDPVQLKRPAPRSAIGRSQVSSVRSGVALTWDRTLVGPRAPAGVALTWEEAIDPRRTPTQPRGVRLSWTSQDPPG